MSGRVLGLPGSTILPRSGGRQMLKVQGLCKSYATPQGALPVLRGIDLELATGQGECSR